MEFSFSADQVSDLEDIISAPRFATYLRVVGGDRVRAMQLYCWNTEVSSAFYVMVQFCELSVRNAAVEAVEAEFGSDWHLNRGSLYTLPILRHGKGYQPRKNLEECAARFPTAGKVVAELSFAFWQYLFVRGQDVRLWSSHFDAIFPGRDWTLTLEQARAKMHQNIEEIRRFRNRIAHHEPIFARTLREDQIRLDRLIHWRRPGAASWLTGVERVTNLLEARP
jgi:hypothetical protein